LILYDLMERSGFRRLLTRLYRVRVEGAGRVPATGPCILVANHESLIDPWILALATRRHIRYMAKAELWRYPVLRSLMEGFGTFPIERGMGDADALGRAGRLLRAGDVLGIFPQGTCLPYRRRPWHRGAARLALATGSPVVPVALVGTERALRPHRIKIGRPKIRVLVADPLDVVRQRPTVAAAKALTARIEETIGELRAPYGPPAHAWID
jgi:1-acyl-sn-glycerol-3-phosphate acyltransferase